MNTIRSLLVPTLFGVGLSLAAAGSAWAEKADRSKPMNVEADALRYDDLQQTSVFTGRVVVTKGTITIRGARVDVRQDPQGFQYGIVTAEPGKLAFYRQKREGVDEWIEGEGEVIEYDGKIDQVKFVRRAEMRRYRGTQLSDSSSGNVIVYNNVTEVYTVDSAPAGSGVAAAQGGRVRAVLGPRDATPAAASAAPRASAPLRSSTTLGADPPQ